MSKKTAIMLTAGFAFAMLLVTALPSEALQTCTNCYRKYVTDDWGLSHTWYDANCCFTDDPWCSWPSQGYYLSTSNRRYCSIGSTSTGYYCRSGVPMCDFECLTGDGGGTDSAREHGGSEPGGAGGEAASCTIEVGEACSAECGTCERNA